MKIKTARVLALIIIQALLVTSCGTSATPTAAPANTHPSVAATSIPSTNTAEPTVEPIHSPTEQPTPVIEVSLTPTELPATVVELKPTPTVQPAPVFDRALLSADPNLPAFSRSITEVRTGTGLSDEKADSTRSVILEYDRNHAFSRSHVGLVGFNPAGEEFTSQAMLYTTSLGLLTEIVGVAKIYFSNELSEAYKANSMENPTTSIIESMNSIKTIMTTESPFGWVVAPTFVGVENKYGIACHRYTFDRASLDTAAMPSDMILTSAGGDLCLAVDGGYLVHGEGKIEGQNLYSSPKSTESILKSGTVVFAQDIKQLEPGFSAGIVTELITQVSSPVVIGVPADYRLAMSQFMDGGESYMYISDQPIEAISAHFKIEMPALGWSLVSAEENAGIYIYKLSKDNLQITVTAIDGVTLPGIKTITIEKSP